jgi:tetratricopeptide (TPR) repeat protein
MTLRNNRPGSAAYRALILLLMLAPSIAWTQANTLAPAPLPPAAQDAVNKGIIAAKVPDYLLAIRFFQEARKIAPQAAVIYLNLGLAESKIPSRELRAMAWFGAYLAASPNAANAAAVKAEIEALSVRSQSNVSRLITAAQDAAGQIPGSERERMFSDAPDTIIGLWASIGNFEAALQSATTFKDPYYKNWIERSVAVLQAKAGDPEGAAKTFVVALRTLDLIKDSKEKQTALHQFASTQAEAGDVAGAIQTTNRVKDPSTKYHPQSLIAMAQAEAGNSAGARETLAALRDTANRAGDPWKDYYKADVAKVEARINARSGAELNAQSAVIGPTADSPVTVSDWLKTLDDDNVKSPCPLNTLPFLDLAGHLNSLPPADDPPQIMHGLRITIERIVKAQNTIAGMLKRQTR